MDIVSEPAFTEETVYDYDVWLPSGTTLSFTVRFEDEFTVDDEGTDLERVHIVSKNPSEEIVIWARHIACSSLRKRVIRKPVTAGPSAQSLTSPTPPSPSASLHSSTDRLSEWSRPPVPAPPETNASSPAPGAADMLRTPRVPYRSGQP